MKILNIGSCNIDYVYELSHIVTPGETADSKSLSLFPGGKGLNQSIAAARSGIDIFHAGCVGNDGLFLKELLESSGVNTKYLKVEDASSGHAIIQVDQNGENSIILYHGTNYMIDKNYIDSVLADFSEGDILILQNEISNLQYIIDKAYKKKMKIVLNPSPITDELKKIDLSKISILILNEIEAFSFSGEKKTDKICEYFKNTFPNLSVVLTLGSKGSIYIDKNDKIFCPSYSVDVVDTTSAGDTFTGYFISGLVKGIKIKNALKLATAAAAISVSRKGASSSIPKIDEVDEALKSFSPNKSGIDKNQEKKDYFLSFIEENLQDVTLKDVAKFMGYSPSHASSWIKSNFGETFSELLQKLRFEKAISLLEETTLPIGEIINLCGYQNESFFRKIFKKHTNQTPFSYRKSFQKGD